MTHIPPRIQTQWGPVTEWARVAAARNMARDINLRDMITRHIATEQNISFDMAVAECKRRYPEAFQGDA